MIQPQIQQIAYRGILDLAKQGKIPFSVEFYNKHIGGVRVFQLPAASNLHGSYAPRGATFGEANAKYGKLYEGYHVSEDYKTRERILFPLAKTLPDAKGNEITVATAKDRIILVKLGIADGKPTIEYEHDAKKRETLIHPMQSEITCVKYPSSYEWYEFKNGEFVESNKKNIEANFLYQANRGENDNDPGASWNGFFVFGYGYLALPEKMSYSVGSFERDLVSGYPPYQSVKVLTIEKGVAEPAVENSA